jgi:EAL domain-containing protein (putative c-di-GMP-specific phosphodiesterase class I)
MSGQTNSADKRPPLKRLLDMQWYLLGSDGVGRSAREIPVNSIPFQIGRRSGLHLTLRSRIVSGLHAEIVPRDDQLLLRDLNSTNGTFINGEKLSGEQLLREGDLVQFADLVFRVLREEERSSTMTAFVADESMPAFTRIDQLIEQKAITPVYQPIVELRNDRVVGYEALARSEVKGLERPDVMFRAAAQLNLQVRLAGICRLKSVSNSMNLPGNPNLYLNIHRDEDLMTDVFESMKLLRRSFPDRPMTVEIHESSVPGPSQMQDFRNALNELNIQVAFDDFGVGQSRLMDLIEVPPDVLKFDISLVQNIDRAHERHLKWIQSLLAATRELGVRALAEGIETAAEAASCRDLGFDLAQGYHFGRPKPANVFAV